MNQITLFPDTRPLEIITEDEITTKYVLPSHILPLSLPLAQAALTRDPAFKDFLRLLRRTHHYQHFSRNYGEAEALLTAWCDYETRKVEAELRRQATGQAEYVQHRPGIPIDPA